MAVWLLLMDVHGEKTRLTPWKLVAPGVALGRAHQGSSASAPFFKNTCATIAFSPVTIFRENRIAHGSKRN
jgi:hypothetical protein